MSDKLSEELWRQFYARMFARAMFEERPEVCLAYVQAISDIVALRKARRERP